MRRPGKERAMKIYKVTDPEFVPYGRVVEGVDFGSAVESDIP